MKKEFEMKRIFIFGFIIFLAITVLEANAINSLDELDPNTLSKLDVKVKGDKISIDVVNVKLAELIQEINTKCNLNIEVEDGFYGRTTIKIEDDIKNIEKILERVIEMTASEYELKILKRENSIKVLKSNKRINREIYKSRILIPNKNEVRKKLEEYKKDKIYSDEFINDFEYQFLFINRKGIKTGGVIAYGKYIEPPYEVLRIKNRIYINGIQVFPIKNLKENSIIRRKTHKSDLKIYELVRIIYNNYYEFREI